MSSWQSPAKADEARFRGVYGCFCGNRIIYVGSSGCGLDTLSTNHRNWKQKYGESGRTNFRSQITENAKYTNHTFYWLVPPAMRTQREVEELEGQLIRTLKPILNIDQDPVKSSIKYGRYDA